MYRIDAVSTFWKQAAKTLSHEETWQLQRALDRLALNPWIGDALGPLWLRELKFGVKRVYFIVGRNVLLVSCSAKNDQRKVIEWMRSNLIELKKQSNEL